MRRRLASPAQPVRSCIRGDAISEVSEPLNSTKQPDIKVRFHAEGDVVEHLELGLVRSEEE